MGVGAELTSVRKCEIVEPQFYFSVYSRQSGFVLVLDFLGGQQVERHKCTHACICVSVLQDLFFC